MKIRLEYPVVWTVIMALGVAFCAVLWKFLLRPALRAIGIL